MIVCVAEKPSVGRDIARVLGATRPCDGYMEGNGYQVTWTFGHLCALLDPHEYDPAWRSWRMAGLPMIPQPFGIKVTDEKGVQKQFDTIKSLIEKADMVINCGDAGQEGELIQRWVYQKAGCKCPVQRLWINSLTDDAIREGFQNLKDQSQYQHLYEAGLMRAIGDWLLGMNATRAYSLRFRDNNSVLSIGRVQTPTLALIVQRQYEIDHFVPRTYWEVKTLYRGVTFNAIVRKTDEEQTKQENIGMEPITNREEGEHLIKALQQSELTVTSVDKKKGTEYAPKLFDLTSLQVECNKKFGYSAERTLSLIQSLYEKHITTYPRVDTTYLSDDIYPKVPGILKGIDAYYPQVQRLRDIMREQGIKSLPKSKKVFDNKKVTDHHAIIPTGLEPKALSEDERKVFDLIAKRFIASFYPDCRISTTTVMAEVITTLNPQPATQNPESKTKLVIPFRVSGREVLAPGWREVFAKDTKDEDEDNPASEEAGNTLPSFTKGEHGPHQPSLLEKQTTPPKPYTEATLLRAMETAGRLVDNDELRDALKENGIGRPSTRAAIIEKLFQRKYIARKGKSIAPTEVGVSLIGRILTPLLKSAELTGIWEKKLRQIERGELSSQDFLTELKQMTCEVVHEVKTSPVGLVCPVCRQGTVIRGRTAYGCSRWQQGCTYRLPFQTL